jgi:hypothetical protein
MRRIRLTAVLAVPLLLLAAPAAGHAQPPDSHGIGFGAIAFRLFPHAFQEGPLFNYGPYYGYYPFTPYGPWDPYLRYNPYFYGDPYRDFGTRTLPPETDGRYGLKSHHLGLPLPALPHLGLSHKSGCTTCGFSHASWVHGGWFHGHTWLAGNTHSFGKPGCASCGGIAVVQPPAPTGDVLTRYSGFGTPAQSAVYYPSTATLDPALELIPTGATTAR